MSDGEGFHDHFTAPSALSNNGLVPTGSGEAYYSSGPHNVMGFPDSIVGDAIYPRDNDEFAESFGSQGENPYPNGHGGAFEV